MKEDGRQFVVLYGKLICSAFVSAGEILPSINAEYEKV